MKKCCCIGRSKNEYEAHKGTDSVRVLISVYMTTIVKNIADKSFDLLILK